MLAPPPAGGVFAKFTYVFILNSEVKGTGVIGAITSPTCGNSATTSTVQFTGGSGVQAHKKVDGTETDYHLTSNGAEASESTTATVTFPVNTKLECT